MKEESFFSLDFLSKGKGNVTYPSPASKDGDRSVVSSSLSLLHLLQ